MNEWLSEKEQARKKKFRETDDMEIFHARRFPKAAKQTGAVKEGARKKRWEREGGREERVKDK